MVEEVTGFKSDVGTLKEVDEFAPLEFSGVLVLQSLSIGESC